MSQMCVLLCVYYKEIWDALVKTLLHSTASGLRLYRVTSVLGVKVTFSSKFMEFKKKKKNLLALSIQCLETTSSRLHS